MTHSIREVKSNPELSREPSALEVNPIWCGCELAYGKNIFVHQFPVVVYIFNFRALKCNVAIKNHISYRGATKQNDFCVLLSRVTIQPIRRSNFVNKFK